MYGVAIAFKDGDTWVRASKDARDVVHSSEQMR
jgi:hypothetical protein